MEYLKRMKKYIKKHSDFVDDVVDVSTVLGIGAISSGLLYLMKESQKGYSDLIGNNQILDGLLDTGIVLGWLGIFYLGKKYYEHCTKKCSLNKEEKR